MGKKLKYADRNVYQITPEMQAYRRKMISASIELDDVIVEIEKKYELSILDVLQLLNKEQETFLRAGLQYEAKERWEEEQNGIQEKASS